MIPQIRHILSSVVATLAIAAGSATAAVELSLNPPAQSAAIGVPFSLTLEIGGLPAPGPDSVGVFEVDILFDASVLQFDGVVFGDPILGDQLDLLGFGTVSQVDDSVPGTVNLFELSLDDPSDIDSLQAGDFTLATLHFRGLAAGDFPISLGNLALGDAYGLPLDAQLRDSLISVSASVPEGAATLVIPGLAGLILLFAARRR